jgi:hypothetical protein
MQTVGELFFIGCQTLIRFSTAAGNLQRKLPSVAEHKSTCACHGDFYQHILSHLLANSEPSKTGAFGIRWLADHLSSIGVNRKMGQIVGAVCFQLKGLKVNYN